MYTRFWWEKVEQRDYLEGIGMEGNILLKWILKKQDCMAWTQWRTQEFCSGGGSTDLVEDRGHRERGSGDSRPLVRGSGGSCNLVQEI